MNADEVREWLSRQPYEPFEVKMSNGDTFEIRHPEMVALGKRRAAIYRPESDSFAHVALIHINSIEALQSA